MIRAIRNTLPLILALAAVSANAQFYKLHNGSLSVGGIGQFTTPLTSSTITEPYNVPFGSGNSTYATTISNQQQGTTNSVGFLTSLQFHPVPWAGIELNYSFNHYSERFAVNYATTSTPQRVNVPTDAHEFTAAYSLHPRHIPFQPFLNLGGGYIDFTPSNASNQWRGAGLAELGFDIPTPNKRIGFRIQGRGLFYRAPNYYSTAFSTRGWRVTAEPGVSVYYRF